MKTIKINVPLTVHYELLPPPVDGEAVQKRIESRWGAVTVTISGSREAVDHMLSVCPTNDPPALIQRALSALGYVVGDHEKDVAQFSRWVDHLAAFPQSEETLELWTNATLARLHATRSVDEASKDAQAIVIQRMRLFPPVPKTGLDDGPLLPEPWAELHEWRSAAKSFDIRSPAELASMTDVSFGEMLDRKLKTELHNATGCESIAEAGERISQLRERAKSAEMIANQCGRDLHKWKAKSGVESPDDLVEKERIIDDAWKEATGAADTHSAYKRIQELESKLLSYAGEIDALRKANSTMVRDPALEMRACDAEHEKRVSVERDLGKVRAELQSKCREAQTERERADKLEAREHALWTSIHRVREAAGLSFGEEILLLIERWCSDKRKEIDKMREALGVVGTDDADLPGHVADLKRAYDQLDPGPPSLEDRAKEANEIGEIISSHLRDSGIEVVANVLANRYHYLSSSWTKTMQAREILLASPGESIVDAAKRTMDRCANLEGQIVADDNRTDELRKILHAKEGESVVDAAKRAIIPLPKPEKIKPGQRWAFVMKATSGPEDGNAYLAGRFRNAWGNHYGALTDDIRTGFYLGT